MEGGGTGGRKTGAVLKGREKKKNGKKVRHLSLEISMIGAKKLNEGKKICKCVGHPPFLLQMQSFKKKRKKKKKKRANSS